MNAEQEGALAWSQGKKLIDNPHVHKRSKALWRVGWLKRQKEFQLGLHRLEDPQDARNLEENESST